MLTPYDGLVDRGWRPMLCSFFTHKQPFVFLKPFNDFIISPFARLQCQMPSSCFSCDPPGLEGLAIVLFGGVPPTLPGAGLSGFRTARAAAAGWALPLFARFSCFPVGLGGRFGLLRGALWFLFVVAPFFGRFFWGRVWSSVCWFVVFVWFVFGLAFFFFGSVGFPKRNPEHSFRRDRMVLPLLHSSARRHPLLFKGDKRRKKKDKLSKTGKTRNKEKKKKIYGNIKKTHTQKKNKKTQQTHQHHRFHFGGLHLPPCLLPPLACLPHG